MSENEILAWIDERIAEAQRQLQLYSKLRELYTKGEAPQAQRQQPPAPTPTSAPVPVPILTPAPAQAEPQTPAAGPLEQMMMSSKKDSTPLADVFVYESFLEIVPKIRLPNSPPFTTFFVDRVLGEMRMKDLQSVNSGVLDPDDATSWEIEESGGLITKVRVNGIDRDDRTRQLRIKEIYSAMRWTLEKVRERESTGGAARAQAQRQPAEASSL